ncbi:MAG: 2-C-methyl-D-erythritol 4-phosphate cytidylyltransferase [Alteromonadaceae bacterium]|nr:2-C-methyl-D-erythritol 4-phosphate cytidylyltransferase [Alteromonadaceae bacterium]
MADTQSQNKQTPLVAVVPAAGVGKRMLTSCPKQYLKIDGLTILEHTVSRLLSYSAIEQVIVVLSDSDEYFPETSLVENPQVQTVIGGQERVDSVLAGLVAVDQNKYSWVLVHDAARPCFSHQDLDSLIKQCRQKNVGGLLASPVRDTMKRSHIAINKEDRPKVKETVDRNNLWHALTPQMYPVKPLISAIKQAQAENFDITDESSAIEHADLPSIIVEGSSDNLKITRPEDLALATFILQQQKAEM